MSAEAKGIDWTNVVKGFNWFNGWMVLGVWSPKSCSLATGDLSKGLDCASRANGQRDPSMLAQSAGLMINRDLRGCYILE